MLRDVRAPAAGALVVITIQTDPPADRVALSVAQWGQLVQDWSPVWEAIREVYDRHQVKHFATEGGSSGPKWRALSPRYKAWKDRVAPGQPILVLTGRLREAATGGAGAIRRQDKTSMELGIDGRVVPYARYHQTGGPRLPRRPVIRFAGSILGDRSVFIRQTDRTTLGYAVRQLVQAHVVRARRLAFGHDTAAADATIARVRRSDAR